MAGFREWDMCQECVGTGRDRSKGPNQCIHLEGDWVKSDSKVRRGILVALTDAPDDAVMEETAFHTRLRVPGEGEPRVVLSNWATDGVWIRLLDRNVDEHGD